MKTTTQYRAIIAECETLFLQKTADYGTAWRILRLSSLTDQLFIKAMRLRSIEEKGVQLVADDIRSDYIGLINYSIIALIQAELGSNDPLELPLETVKTRYRQQADETHDLMISKNHDYGEAWRDMRISSLTDLMLMKLLRLKQIEDNGGKTIVSEGIAANYQDIINYAAFALIKIDEAEKV